MQTKVKPFLFTFAVLGFFSVIASAGFQLNLANAPVHKEFALHEKQEKFLNSKFGIYTTYFDQDSLNFYISPQGSDSVTVSAGTKNKPVASVGRVVELIKIFIKVHGYPKEGINVHIADGIYHLNETIKLDSIFTGTKNAPIVFKAEKGANPVLSGGYGIPHYAIKTVKDDSVLKRFINPKARENVLQVNLRELGITDYGKLIQAGFPRFNAPTPIELVFNNEFMTLARWPNEGKLQFDSIIESGSAERYDKISESKPIFRYNHDRPGKWKSSEDIWIYGIFNQPWAPDFIRVSEIIQDKKHIALAQDHYYGFEKHEYNDDFMVSTWYRFVNILEELDSPGEWFLDRNKGLLYFWPPDKIENYQISLTMFDEDYMVSIEGASYVKFRGLTFGLSRRNGIRIRGGQGNVFAGCTFKNMGGMAATIDANQKNTNAGNGLLSCDIYGMGTTGIRLGGGNRKTIEPGENFAINNHIYRCGRRIQTYTPAIKLSGVGNRVSNNLIHHMPHFAVMFSGNEHIIELNEIHRVALKFSDAGAIYTAANPFNRGTVIQHNFIHHMGLEREKVNGIYIDYVNCGTIVRGNVFYKLVAKDNFGAVMINGGNDNIITNNIFINCLTAMHISNFLNGWGYDQLDGFLERWKQSYNRLNCGKPPYSERYPQVKTFFDDNHRIPSRNKFEDNLMYKCPKVYRERYDADLQKDGNYKAEVDPGFEDAENMNFDLKPGSIVFEKIPDFEPIPFEKIGLYEDGYRNK